MNEDLGGTGRCYDGEVPWEGRSGGREGAQNSVCPGEKERIRLFAGLKRETEETLIGGPGDSS